ncbi:hypothetical protein [Candidatus Magnetaquicoccus inordinatus]|uniref:hypothetical protein n=1 Tax=Candidatus Magnetaquicoccus inordinatus TaxID=2496818 RepID=UPI00102C4E9E|nr:hypothetical protein [Candidatus Magnetaquicoccus inordinatus]
MRWFAQGYARLCRRQRLAVWVLGAVLLLALWYRWQWLPFAQEWQRLQHIPGQGAISNQESLPSLVQTQPWLQRAGEWLPYGELAAFMERLTASTSRRRLLARTVLPEQVVFRCAATQSTAEMVVRRHALQLTWEGGYGEMLALLHQWQHLPWRVVVERLEYSANGAAGATSWRIHVHFLSMYQG